jgi:FkbM family methyltransferase
MPISLNPNPRMTRHLVTDTRIFRDDPLVVVDVGARSGFKKEWKAFGDALRVYCFEADAEECNRLNDAASGNVVYLPYVLGAKTGDATLHHTRFSDSSGLYQTNWDYFSRLLNRDNGITEKQENIRVTTLTDALSSSGVKSVDFLKLDVEGAELDVLRGATSYVESGRLIGVLSEFRFHEEINGSPPFWQLDAYLQQRGFRLYDMHFSHQSRRVLPYEGLSDYRLPNGERFFAYTVNGQIQDGDALYFRDLLIPANAAIRRAATPVQLLKAACLLEVYALSDCAAEVVVEHRERLAPLVDCDRLLDFLTPPFKGQQLGYREYLDVYFERKPFDIKRIAMPPLRRTRNFVRRAIRKLLG